MIKKKIELVNVLIIIAVIVNLIFFAVLITRRINKNMEPSNATVVNSSNTASKDVANLSEYKNNTLGIKFSYPKSWGVPVNKEGDNNDVGSEETTTEGAYTEYEVNFPNVPLTLLPLMNRANNSLVLQQSCYNLPAFYNGLVLNNPEAADQIKNIVVGKWKDEAPQGSNQFTTTSRFLVSNKTTTIIEQFQSSIGFNNEQYCNGLAVYGVRKIESPTKNVGEVHFIWSKVARDNGKNQPSGGPKDIEEFKKDPSKYISSHELDQIKNMISSIQPYQE